MAFAGIQRNSPLVAPVVVAESLHQARLLDERHPDRVDGEEGAEPDQQRSGAEQHRLAEQDRQHTRDHRIAHVAVGAQHDQAARRPRAQACPPMRAKSEIVRYIRASPAAISAQPATTGTQARAAGSRTDVDRAAQEHDRHGDDDRAHEGKWPDRPQLPPDAHGNSCQHGSVPAFRVAAVSRSVEGVQHRFIEAGGLRMHVAEAGQGDPLVLLHGWPSTGTSGGIRSRAVAALPRICPDLRGPWSDAPPRGYDKESLAADVVNLLDALGPRR